MYILAKWRTPRAITPRVPGSIPESTLLFFFFPMYIDVDNHTFVNKSCMKKQPNLMCNYKEYKNEIKK